MDIIRDDIICTMSDILFELSSMFKTIKIQNLTSTLKKELIELKNVMNEKKNYRKELLIFGYIHIIQISLTNKILIPIDVKKLCLSYY